MDTKVVVGIAVSLVLAGVGVLVRVTDVIPRARKMWIIIGNLLILTGGVIIGVLILGAFGVGIRSPFFLEGGQLAQADPCVVDVTKDPGVLKVWGPAPSQKGGPYRVQAVIDGQHLLSYRTTHKVAVMAYHSDGTKDYLDITDLQKSALYDIQDADIHMVFNLTENYINESEHGMRGGTNYFVFLVPKEVGMDQFSTIRQAKTLGVIQLAGMLGAP